jgi:hypothetical protein
MRFIVLYVLFITINCPAVYAQDSLAGKINNGNSIINQKSKVSILDFVVLATRAREKFVADSIAMQYIKYPDSASERQYINRLLKEKAYTGRTFLDIPYKIKGLVKDGHARQTRDQWVIVIIILLLIYTAILNIALNKDIKNVLLSFYSKRVLSQTVKEETAISFWAFIGLFLLFGATFGLFLYQLSAYNNAYYSISGFRLFVALSLIVISLFSVKFLVLKFIGFIFDINSLVSEYVSVLYLTYFNIAFIFLPVAVCFSLLDVIYIPYLLATALALIIIVFSWLYLRSSVNIISNFRFHKFYLFIYLCALEICPILILIKALNI